jgi:uroporphyrinogen decarboxylase
LPYSGTGKLELMTSTPNDVIGLDWAVDISVARQTLGAGVKVQGNLDPMILFGPEEVRHTGV